MHLLALLWKEGNFLMNLIDIIEQEQTRKDIVSFSPGDTVRVHVKVVEGGRERIQVFEGLVIAVGGHEGEKTFTVRKISSGVGVERIWPIDSPFIQKIEVVGKGDVKRAKLYYLRNRTGRLALKVKTRFGTKETHGTTGSTKPTDKETTGKSGGESSETPASE